MKKIIFILFFNLLTNTIVFSQSYDFTFCYGNISITLFDGGKCQMVRYSPSGQVVSRVSGEFTVTNGGSPDKLDIDFQGQYFKYYLFRDGSGKPSSILDGPGRTYKLCKTSISKNQETLDDDLDSDQERSRYIESMVKRSEKDKQLSNEKIMSLNSFTGIWGKNDLPRVKIIISEVPFEVTKENQDGEFIADSIGNSFRLSENIKNDLLFRSNDKPMLLKISVFKNSQVFFEGISYSRGVGIRFSDQSPYTSVNFIGGSSNYPKEFSITYFIKSRSVDVNYYEYKGNNFEAKGLYGNPMGYENQNFSFISRDSIHQVVSLGLPYKVFDRKSFSESYEMDITNDSEKMKLLQKKIGIDENLQTGKYDSLTRVTLYQKYRGRGFFGRTPGIQQFEFNAILDLDHDEYKKKFLKTINQDKPRGSGYVSRLLTIEEIKQLQKCLGLPIQYQTGKFGPMTKKEIESRGIDTSNGLTSGMFERICGRKVD